MSEHKTELLGAYVLGVLDGEEWTTVQTHLRDCPYCRQEADDLRQLENALGEIPPEAFLDGPPPDGEQLLQRTLKQVRGEGNRRAWLRRTAWALAAALIGVVALGTGAILGRDTAPTGQSAATGWVRVHATVSGAPAGEQCRLYVVAKDGSRREAGSWLVPAKSTNGTSLDGAALVAPADVIAVQAETFAAQPLVTVPV
jgi:anti-sigma factor RsiW